jgi:hypothetical protein
LVVMLHFTFWSGMIVRDELTAASFFRPPSRDQNIKSRSQRSAIAASQRGTWVEVS